MPTQIARRRFTVEEYYRMAEAGILGPGDRVELIGGEVIEKVAIGPRHAACVRASSYVLQPALGARAIVQVQGPVRLGSDDEPGPDLAVLRPPRGRYRVRHAEPGDTRLVVEVADSTIEFDREVKLPLYARAGIPEAWLVDLDDEVLEVYRVPARRGYRETRRLDRDTPVALHAVPDVELAIRVFFE
jgi:Uma2 family endonuclease